MKRPARGISTDAGERLELVAETLAGLEGLAREELERLRGVRVLSETPGEVRFTYGGDAKRLRGLRTVVAVYLALHFDVPRPKALLGHQHLTRLVETLRKVNHADQFTSFRFGAAGSDSAVFARLAAALESSLNLPYDAQTGDLLLRVRPARGSWEVLIRLTPRPLSARDWRVCNRAGGLNATLAAAMVEVAGARSDDRFLNAMCGSGTLLIERRLAGKAARLVGVDNDAEALGCAQANVLKSGFQGDIDLLKGDATQLTFSGDSFDVMVADVPWGDAVGSHRENASLYPSLLTELARVGTANARCVILTHDIKLFERVLGEQSAWRLVEGVRVAHSGHHPRMYGLERA